MSSAECDNATSIAYRLIVKTVRLSGIGSDRLSPIMTAISQDEPLIVTPAGFSKPFIADTNIHLDVLVSCVVFRACVIRADLPGVTLFGESPLKLDLIRPPQLLQVLATTL